MYGPLYLISVAETIASQLNSALPSADLVVPDLTYTDKYDQP